MKTQTVQLGKLVEIERGKKSPQLLARRTPTSHRYLQIDDLRPDATPKFVEPFACPKASVSDVVIAWDGANAGTVACNLDGYIGSTLALLRPKTDMLCPPYLSRFLEGKFDYLQENATGATIPHLSRDVLEELTLPIRDLSEQRQIAERLEQADRLRRTRRYALELSDTVLPAAFLQLFGDASRGQSRYPLVHINELCDSIVDCVNKTAPTVEEVTPFIMIRTSNIRAGEIRLDSVSYVTAETFDIWTRRSVPLVGDVILTREAPLGEVGIVKTSRRIFLGQRLMQYRAAQGKAVPEFILHALLSPDVQRQLRRLGAGSTVEHVAVPECETLLVPFVPLAKQQQFAELAERHERLRAVQRESLRQAEHLFQSLLHAAFAEER